MNNNPRPDLLDERVDRTLRSLDAGGVVDADDLVRAATALDSILAAPPVQSQAQTQAQAQELGPGHRRWFRPLAWLLPATAAAAAAWTFVVPSLTGTDGRAFATWSRTPSPVAPAALEEARRGCQESFTDAEERAADIDASVRPDIRAHTARLVAAERRGDIVFVALATESGALRHCLSHADRPGRTLGSGGSDPVASARPAAALTRGQVEGPGPGEGAEDGHRFRMVVAKVGPGVTGLTLHDGATTVEATVADGWFAAWWLVPSDAAQQPSRPGPQDEAFYTVDVVMDDGTVINDAPVTGRTVKKEPGAREIGRMATGGGSVAGRTVRHVQGRAGSEVATVTVRAGASEAVAVVENGRFSVEWTVSADSLDSSLSYDLTLRDGTVSRDVKPVS